MGYRLHGPELETFDAPSYASALAGAVAWSRATGQTITIEQLGPVGSSVVARVRPDDTVSSVRGGDSL